MRADTRAERTRRLFMWSAISTLVLLPLLAMRFTAEVAWTAGDFLAAAVLLGAAGAAYEFVAWRTRDRARRAVAAAVIVAIVAVIWAHGAVGLT